MPAVIIADHPQAFGQTRADGVPDAKICAKSVSQHKNGAVLWPLFYIMQTKVR